MEQTKNYSLLRPFDLEAAKRGEPILWIDNPVRWIALSDQAGDARNIVEHAQGLSYVRDKELRMAPLCWVEGRPVYKGDVLYRPSINDGPVVASRLDINGSGIYLRFEGNAGSEYADNRHGRMSWADPNSVLCEVQGKPVRMGDRLWTNCFKEWFAVAGKVDTIKEVYLINERHGYYTLASSCSWKRKVTKQGFINIYPTRTGHQVASTSHVHATRKEADESAGSDRIFCLPVEWPEEVDE